MAYVANKNVYYYQQHAEIALKYTTCIFIESVYSLHIGWHAMRIKSNHAFLRVCLRIHCHEAANNQYELSLKWKKGLPFLFHIAQETYYSRKKLVIYKLKVITKGKQ